MYIYIHIYIYIYIYCIYKEYLYILYIEHIRIFRGYRSSGGGWGIHPIGGGSWWPEDGIIHIVCVYIYIITYFILFCT